VLFLFIASVSGAWENFFIMMFENHGYNQVMNNSKWTSIINSVNTFQLSNYHAVSHPSQPNYVSHLGGSWFNCSDDLPCNLPYKNLVDLLEAKGLTWKAYMEDYAPGLNGACNMATDINSYARRHNPFQSFTDITSDPKRCAKIVNADAIQKDVMGSLPNFGYYTPTVNNDSHDQDLDFSGDYLSNWLDSYYTPYANKAWANTLFMITFDEDENTEGNHVVAFFKNVKLSNHTDDGVYTHYSVPKFVENNWNLGSLGQNDVTANDFGPALH